MVAGQEMTQEQENCASFRQLRHSRSDHWPEFNPHEKFSHIRDSEGQERYLFRHELLKHIQDSETLRPGLLNTLLAGRTQQQVC